MSDGALEFAEERGLGKVLGRLRLDSGIAIPGGARSRANLLLSESGLWLVAARDRFHGQHLDLLTRGDLRLVPGRIRDRLCYGQEALTIPAGRRPAVERLIALARLSPGAAPSRAAIQPSRLVEQPDELGQAWLKLELAPDEVLVAWLRGENLVAVHSHVVGETRRTPYFFVSERRAAIVIWSAVGDVSYAPLEASSVRARAEGDKTELTYPAGIFLSRRGDSRACRDALDLLSLEPAPARLLEAARRLWLTAESSKTDSTRSLALLDAAIERGSQKARFARLLGGAQLAAESAAIDANAVAQALAGGELAPHELADLWLGFRFSKAAGSLLVRALLDLGAGHGALPFAFALQRRIHDTPGTDAEVAEDELRLAHFAVRARLASSALPDERDRVLDGVLDAQGLARRHSPFVPPRTPLASDSIENTLTHPLARGQNSLVAGVQKLIALSPEPDHVALNDYCEALDAGQQPEAKRALDAARLAFSLPDLRAYVSRGKKSIGLRGYEGTPPYVLLGKEHLDPDSPYGMNETELAFAIGVEALHLKLGQARLTSNDVWAGAWSRTKGGVDLVLGLLPLLKGLPLAMSVTKFLDKIPEPALRRGLEALIRFGQQRRVPIEPSDAPSALSHINEDLVAAHRLMQMSADRAGLVLSGDLRSSLRGMLLVRPDTRALLEALVERDLVSALLDSEIEPALQRDLVLRVAALLHFFESDDYLALRRMLQAG
ncbi:MAG TPA: hypothetical protein VHM25_07060 [Polyangiaceae bacterium]|jgi:hypothetical protein|nr:hypothetical protein [Polyangiaceae bacterium]